MNSHQVERKDDRMSHIVEAKTSITFPDEALLRQAAQVIAQQHGGSIQAYYLDYYHQQRQAPLAIQAPDLPRGIGLKVNAKTGELTFIGDNWGYETLYAQIQQEVVQAYVSLATMQALQQMGYSAQASEAESGQVIIEGVSYA
jgi:hypothetical protein